MKVVIVGGGSAGTTCAHELRKLDKDVEITVLESSSHTEYSPCALPYVISGEIKRFEDIFLFNEKDYSSNKISLSSNSEVVDIDRKEKIVTYKKNDENRQIGYDKLVLATGSSSFIPPIKGIEDVDHHTLKTIDDAKKISADIKKDSSSVIIGGGLIGVELAVSLAKKKEKVTIIESKESIFPSILDGDMAQRLKEYLEKENIKVYEKQTIQKITSKKILLKDKEVTFDKLFFCTGIRANISLAEKLGLDVDEAIIVDKYLQTSDKNIFACGDCVKSSEFNTGEKILSQLGTTAVRQAKTIAKNIVSKTNTKFPQVLNNTITKVGSIFVASVGLTVSRSKQLGIRVISASYTGDVRSGYYPSESRIRIKLVCSEDGKIIGGQIVGDEEVVGRINTIALAIKNNLHVKDLAALETCYNPASSPIFDPLTITAEICMKKIDLRKGV